MSIAALFYVVLWVSLTYLIYRYARYSRWTETAAGKGFMLMKVAFWSVISFALVSAALPEGGVWREIVRPIVLGLVQLGVMVQIAIVVKEQGGRKQPPG